MDPVVTIEFENRLRAVFTDDVEQQDKDFPFIVEVLVHEESLDSVILDVMYQVPQNDGLVYVLSVRPERSEFDVDEKTLKSGLNAERVTIFFSPDSMFKRRVDTEYLTFYIDAFGNSDVDRTYIRKASFAKSWRKQKRRGIFLRRSLFRTE